MGNCINVFDREGNLISQGTHGMTCCIYANEIIKQYNPNFDMFRLNDVNEQMKSAYDNGSPEDIIILLIFMNDESEFEESDLPDFEKAIAKLDPGNRIHQNIKMHLEAYMRLIKEFKYINTKYVGCFSAMTVVGG